MKRITRLMSICAITMAMVSRISCSKNGSAGPAGPAGPAGAAGPADAPGAAGKAGAQGPIGQSGNANVMQYLYDEVDMTDPAYTGFGLTLPAANDTLDKCAWFMYMFKDNIAYAMPGAGADNASTYSFLFAFLF